MSNRREVLLDAAISVLGTAGVRGLTHRAVDAAAGLPAGSASNPFRTRDALLDAVVVRCSDRERALWADLVAGTQPGTLPEFARALADAAQLATGPHRTLTLARYAILVEAGIRPALRAQLLATGAEVDAWGNAWLRLAGSTDPDRDAPIIMNHWTGVVLHDLAVPDPAFDPYPQIAALVAGLVHLHGAEVSP